MVRVGLDSPGHDATSLPSSSPTLSFGQSLVRVTPPFPSDQASYQGNPLLQAEPEQDLPTPNRAGQDVSSHPCEQNHTNKNVTFLSIMYVFGNHTISLFAVCGPGYQLSGGSCVQCEGNSVNPDYDSTCTACGAKMVANANKTACGEYCYHIKGTEVLV